MTNEEKILHELKAIREEQGVGCGTAIWMFFVILFLFGISLDIAKIVSLLKAMK